MSESNDLIARHLPAARDNCTQSWSRLIEHFQAPLLAYCTGIIGDRDDAFDVVQNTFLKAMRYLHTLRDDRGFTSWLYSIARQHAIDHLRTRVRRYSMEAQLFKEPTFEEKSPENCLLRNEDVKLVVTLMHQLEVELREPLILHYLEEFALADIASIMQIPAGTIKSRLHRARKIIKTQMDKAHEPAI